jgi:RNA polymerase subunit RPABC4/transcription elongation factor Spt4
MALIKCIECGQEVSTEAKMCPHCGKPKTFTPIISTVVEEDVPKEGTAKAIIGFLILGLLFFGFYCLTRANSSYSGSGTFIGTLSQDLNRGDFKKIFNDIFPSQQNNAIAPSSNRPTSNGTQVPLQEVKNLGYDFYVGEIESSGTTNITDDLKNQITKIAYTAQFPISLLKSVPIIILNNLALTGNQYVSVPIGNLKIPDLKPDFLSEGGIYGTFTGGGAIIFINKPIIAQGQLTEVLTHELGHAVGSKLTDQDWTKFYQLRGIPAGTARHGTNWNLSPEEDFAEVYKNVFTGIAVRTYYGLLLPRSNYESMLEEASMNTCGKIYAKVYGNYIQQFQEPSTCPTFDPSNPSNGWANCLGQIPKSPTTAQISQAKNVANADTAVQSCRRDVLSNPSKYTSDWQYEIPYDSSVNQTTKNFITSIVNRLNQ